jgi:hypothetical protein
MAERFRLFSIVFSEPYLTYFERGCVRSLMWPDNRASLGKVEAWDIWTQEPFREQVEAIVKPCGIPIEWHTDVTYGGKKDNSLAQVLIGEMHLCLSRGVGMLWAAPDCIFGDGSIRTLTALATVPGISPCLMPIRVKAKEFLAEMGDEPISNAGLVRMGMRHAYEGFLQANAELSDTNSVNSGVSWRKIGPGLYAITTRVPSAFILQPTKRDIQWFGDKPKFGNYDHQFGHILLQEGRQRIIGSSDAAFVVELTHDPASSAKTQRSNPAEPDRYFQNLPHYLVNRNTLCIWREG